MAKAKDDPTPEPVAASTPDLGVTREAIEVWERLALHGDAGTTNRPIALTIPGDWYCRWINTAEANRWATVVYEKRMIPVRVSELADARTVTGHTTSPEGYVTRGDRGQEILVRMPREMFERIQRGKAERLQQKANSQSAQKEELQHALAGKFGPQAAEAVRDFKGTIQSGTVLEARED